ncbi:MAG: hypothetical protein IK142_08810 [Clostridiales bacterium]|nr:hypothetical protein [Clostridiales bacterium]
MVKNQFGRKVIGATLSMVMMASAIPGMTSLASENVPQNYEATAYVASISKAEARQNLGAIIDALGSIKTDDNEFESIEVYHHYNSWRHWGVEIYCNTDKFSTDYIVNYTNFLNEIYPAFLASIVTPDAERNAALQNLSDIVDEMIAFKTEFEDELRAIDAYYKYCEWRRLGIEAYCNTDDYSTEYFVELSSILHSVHDAAVEALNPTGDHTLFPQIVIDNDDVRFNAFIVDAETPAEEIAPDYGMTEEIAPDYGMTEEIAPDYGMDFEEENVSPLFLQLCDLFDEVYDFEVSFADEIPMAQRHFLDLEMDRALDVAASAENLSDDEIETMIFELQLAYNTAIDAIDAAPAQATVQTVEITVEEIAPDYGMNLDEDTLPEEPAETTDDTLYVIYGEQPEDMDLTGVGLIIQDRCPTNFEETTPDEIIPEERPLVIYGEQPEDMDISTVDLLVQDRCPTL